MKRKTCILVLFVLPSLVMSQLQDAGVKREIATIAEKVDSTTATRTSELLAMGIPSYVEAFKLAYQGIDSKAIAELGAAGLDLPKLFRSWPPTTIRAASIFSDWVVIGKVVDIRYVNDAVYNKYVYVRVERWLKGDSKLSMVVVRATGSGPTSNPRIFSSVSGETEFNKGDRLLLLLNRCGFLLYGSQFAPYETETFKEDHKLMCFSNTWKKLTIEEDSLVEASGDGHKRYNLDNILDDITSDVKKTKKFFRKGYRDE